MQVPQWVETRGFGVIVIGAIGIHDRPACGWLGSVTLCSTVSPCTGTGEYGVLSLPSRPFASSKVHDATRCTDQTDGVSKNDLYGGNKNLWKRGGCGLPPPAGSKET